MEKPNYTQEQFELVYKLLVSLRDGTNGFQKQTQKAIAYKITLSDKLISLFLKPDESTGEQANQSQKNRIVENMGVYYEHELRNLKESLKPKEFDTYIYYYLSYNGIVKPALMRIATNAEGWSTEKGELIYYTKNEKTKKIDPLIFLLNRTNEIMKAPNGQPQVAFFKAVNTQKQQVNFFTINVKGLKIDNRHIMFLTYSVVETQNYELSCGYGILIKEEDEEKAMAKIMESIESKVDDWIVNALQNKKMNFGDLEHDVYKTEKDLLIKHNQYIASNELAGYYLGYFLSKDRLDTAGEFGRVVRTILEIRANGSAYLYYDSFSNKMGKYEPRYEGVFYFPTESYVLVKGSFAYHKAHKAYRYHIYLDATRAKLKGVFSGWTQGLSIYSTPIFFEKIPNVRTGSAKELESIIDKYKPKRIPRDELEKDEKLVMELREKFTLLCKDYMSIPDDCFPEK